MLDLEPGVVLLLTAEGLRAVAPGSTGAGRELRWVTAPPGELWRELDANGVAGVHAALAGPTSAPIDWALEEITEGQRLRVSSRGADRVGISLPLASVEALYGLGERFDHLDQRGALRHLWVENGAYGDKSYKPVPVVLSSSGYGLALSTTRAVTVSAGSSVAPGRLILISDGADAEFIVFAGEDLAAVLERFTSWVGRPETPPAWFFLPWKMGDWTTESQATALEDLDKQIELGVRFGAKVLDAGWERETHDFVFNVDKYPDPAGLISHARARDTEFLLWVSPSITAGTAAYAEAAAAGVLVRDEDGRPYVHDLGNQPGWEGSAIDFTSDRARRWWQDKLRPLLALGVRGFKTDFGEQLPADCVLSDGRRGAEVHNDYPRLYNEATWEVVRPVGGVLVARSAWLGSQKLSAIWAGDQSSDYSPWAGLPSAIIAGQSAGLSGFPYWGSDIGGYFGSPTAECFIRWVEFSAFCPLMELHGLGVREPWAMGAEVLGAFVRYARVHAGLQEYSLLAAEQARATGLPLMRAMALLCPPVELPRFAEYQYGYGPDLLIAPVYAAARHRRVLLPPGTWWSRLERRFVSGPAEHELAVALEEIPVFVRAGAIVPFMQTDTERACELHLYPHPGERRRVRLLDRAEVEMGFDGRMVVLHIRRSTRALELVFPTFGGRRMTVRSENGCRTTVRRVCVGAGDADVVVEVADAHS